jgi:hypothetical protein
VFAVYNKASLLIKGKETWHFISSPQFLTLQVPANSTVCIGSVKKVDSSLQSNRTRPIHLTVTLSHRFFTDIPTLLQVIFRNSVA